LVNNGYTIRIRAFVATAQFEGRRYMLFNDFTLFGNDTPSMRTWDTSLLTSPFVGVCAQMMNDLRSGIGSVPCPIYDPPAYFVSLGLPDTDREHVGSRIKDEAHFFFVRRESETVPFRVSVVLGHGDLKYNHLSPSEDAAAVVRIVDFSRRFAGLPEDIGARDTAASFLLHSRPLLATAFRPMSNEGSSNPGNLDNPDTDFWAAFAAGLLSETTAPLSLSK
jgi:hypothetical protein